MLHAPIALPLSSLFLASVVLSGETQLITVEDVGSNEFGQVSVSHHRAELPPAPTGGGGPISQLPGFPVTMGSLDTFAPWRGVALADLTGDGYLEIIGSSTDSQVYAWDHTGALLPGFPVSTIGWAQNAPAVGDVTGDGNLEIVQTTRGPTSGGRLHVFDAESGVALSHGAELAA
jgi:hypothetical protein